jgi:hypothetical protein
MLAGTAARQIAPAAAAGHGAPAGREAVRVGL